MFIICVCSSARRRWRGIQRNPPLGEHGCDASKSVWEHAREVLLRLVCLSKLSKGRAKLSQGDFLHT